MNKERNIFYACIFLFLLSLWTVKSFLPSMLWAAILGIATWPTFLKLKNKLKKEFLAALIMTFLVGLCIGIPLFGFLIQIGIDLNNLWSLFVQNGNKSLTEPSFISEIPMIGKHLHDFWQTTLQNPGVLLSKIQLALKKDSTIIIENAQFIGGEIGSRFVILGLTLFVLFFVYISGEKLVIDIKNIGVKIFGNVWIKYVEQVAPAIRATVNGLLLVALIEALGMGLAYYFAGVPSFMLLATITGFLSILPGVAPLVVCGVLVYLWFYGTTIGFSIVLINAIIFLGVFDSWARPYFIGNTIKLSFLAVFFSILGGLEALGLVGLFIAPTIMVMFNTLWKDLANKND